MNFPKPRGETTQKLLAFEYIPLPKVKLSPSVPLVFGSAKNLETLESQLCVSESSSVFTHQ